MQSLTEKPKTVDEREAGGADYLDLVISEGVWDVAGGGADADIVDEQGRCGAPPLG
jgi:hypothetical protein